MPQKEIRQISSVLWELPKSYKEGMLVPGRIYATAKLLDEMDSGVFEQLANLACMPGIVSHSIAMPDAHWGYGSPVGGVAAFDAKEGVISPGVIGFDINCIAGNSLILTEHGCRKPIRDFLDWKSESIKCFSGKSFSETDLTFFLKKFAGKAVEITTETGRKITATNDHPFLAKSGMVEAGKLKELQEIAILPFEGVQFETASDKIIVSENDISASYSGNANGLNQITAFLKKRNLLPLRENSPALPYLAKIFGIVQGDGTINFSRKSAQLSIYGKKSDLEKIKSDMLAMGFKSQIYSRKRGHLIKTKYGEVKFDFEEHSLHCGSRAMVLLMKCLGIAMGNKSRTEFGLPEWLLCSPLWIKRLFLASFFGAELSSPKIVSGLDYNFYAPVLSMNKQAELGENARAFLLQIKSLLKEFGVKSNLICEREEYVNPEGIVSTRFRLQISSEPQNLISLWLKIGFEYNEKKWFAANLAGQYLKHKQLAIAGRVQSIQAAKELKSRGNTLKQVALALAGSGVNERFVARSIWENRKTPPRISSGFATFEQFVEEKIADLGESGACWEKIASIKEVEFSDWVYDFTTKSDAHNFVANNFVVSNCGIRLATTNLSFSEVKPKLAELVHELFKSVPSGVGAKGFLKLSKSQFEEVMLEGSNWCLENNFAWKDDISATEDNGCIPGANPEKVSKKAIERGLSHLGTLGSGNHYLEIQVVKKENVFDQNLAKEFGISAGDAEEQVCIMLHCGSRGFGHQIATDYLERFGNAMQKFGIKVNDRELACAPCQSEEGKDYFGAMACAANMAFANRQVILHRVRGCLSRVFGKTAEEMEVNQVYDVCHNIAKIENYKVEGRMRELMVHRKGATRSLGPGNELLQEKFRRTGQPVIIGGSMETGSYLLVGTKKAEEEAFGSTCHGSGRTMSRTKAKREVNGKELQRHMAELGIIVESASMAGLAEEAGVAYKEISEVIEAVEEAGLNKKIVALKPVGNVKG